MAGKALVVEREPTFVDDQQCRTAVEPPLDTMKEIGQHCRRGPGADQTLGFKGLNFSLPQALGLGIEQAAIGSAEAIGLQSSLERLGLQQHRQPSQRAFGDRCGSERRQCRPEMVLRLRHDDDRLTSENVCDPFCRPTAFRGIVNQGQRLKRDRFGGIVRQRAADIMPVASHGERGHADRAAEVEGEDLGVRITAELQRHQREQHRFASAGRTHHQRMADIADMQRKSKWGRALGSREE